MLWTVETIQRAILQEARKVAKREHDKLAPSVAISLLSETKWYVSIVRWPDRGRKIVENAATSDDLLKALVTVATGFVPQSHPAWLDTAAQHSADPNKDAHDLEWANRLIATHDESSRADFPDTCGGSCGGADPDCNTCR